jgi:type 1 glutamine amidotransferase
VSFVLGVLCLLGALAGTAAGRKIVLVAGPLDSHPYSTHEYEKNIILLRHLIETTPAFRGARVETHFDGWPADPAALDDADTIFLTSGGSDRKLEDHPLYVGDRIAQLEKQMKRGCGIVFFHWSTFHPRAHHDRITEWAGGYFDHESGPPPRKWFSKIETREWTTAIGAPDHPVARGLKPFRMREEFYFNLRFRDDDPRLKPILLCRPDGDARANTVAWAVERADGGRGFGTTGGHFTANWNVPEFRKMILNAIAWSAKIEIPAEGIDSELGPPSRILVVTGHNHPAHDWRAVSAALFHLLEQDPRLRVEVTENPEDLATRKLGDYAATLLNYNNWDRAGLSEAAQAAFTRYLSGGGGAAVVHFANGAFNPTIPRKDSDWPEYRRIARRAWMHPESGHDAFGNFRVEITRAEHPITRGLAPFETTDELYFKQTGDLPIEPLATARSKVTGKDEPMAWAHDFGEGRVFQTVLGHSDLSIRRAGALIRRGVAWAAGLDPLSFDPPSERTEKVAFRPGSPWVPKKPQEEKKPLDPARDKQSVLPPNPGLDGGKGGHWGLQKESDWVDARFNATVTGPFITCTLSPPGGVAAKAVSIKLGDGGVCFDTADLSYRAGWTGRFVLFGPARFGLIEMPKIVGDVRFSLPKGPAWGSATARYHGLHVNGPRVVLDYHVDGAQVLDAPWMESAEGVTAFTRTLQSAPCERPRVLAVAEREGSKASFETLEGLRLAVLEKDGEVVAAAVRSSRGFALDIDRGSRIVLPLNAEGRIKLLAWSGPKEQLPRFAALIAKSAPPEDLAKLVEPGPPRWSEAIVTRGHVAKADGPYVIDTLTMPYDNPWKALMFAGGHDFFSNGDAAVATVHGDVWLVRGIDEKLERLEWRRFATGLYQPLGLRIVEDKVCVLGRDQITRLHDGNGDGEADFYECVTNDFETMSGGHDYYTNLESDREGRFHFLSPRGLHRVAGRTETVASGWRHANGLSVGPDGTITVAPQEGEWTPASMICEAKPGGWYGFGGPKVAPSRPLGYDPPLCYLPRHIDNSSGGQVWVTGGRWGPLEGQLLNLSYGRSSMQLILRDVVDGQAQGAAVPLGLHFASGVMRGRFHPKDGQLYVTGMKGWVTNAARDGCFQRVRYTGQPVRLPLAWSARSDGLRVAFSVPLDRAVAEDPDSWALEQWNYRYSAKYGSEEYSAAQPDLVGHDPLEVRAVTLSVDGKTARLEVPQLAPVHQLRIRYSLRDAEGTSLRGELAGTVHRVGK